LVKVVGRSDDDHSDECPCDALFDC
jgi:hypothetical protein